MKNFNRRFAKTCQALLLLLLTGSFAQAQFPIFNPPITVTGSYAQTFTYPIQDGWKNSAADDINWTKMTGPTPSVGTGPSSAFDGSHYIYVEASGNTNKTAILKSPTFNLSPLTRPHLEFWAHMDGSNMGELKLQYSVNGFNWQNIFVLSGSYGPNWIKKEIDLNSLAVDYQTQNITFRFYATTGTSYSSDIAVDFFKIDNTGAFKNSPSTNESALTTSEITVYPNPFNQHFSVEWEAPHEELTIQLFDLQGKLIMENEFQNFKGTATINTSEIPAGAYILKLNSGDVQKATRMFKN